MRKPAASKEDAALYAEMLSLPNDGRYPALHLTPEQRRQRTLETLWAQVEVLARQNPVLMVFEDAHWSDPTSLEALSRAVNRIASLPILLIVTFRPEFDPPWIGRPHVTALTLNRLAEREVSMMIDRVVGSKPLPANVRRDIIERTDGVPLFVEEITRAVLEAESAAKHVIAAILSTATEVPASLHASLMARLDRLGPAKEVAQIGAAIGREFSHALLSAVAQKPEAQLNSAIEALLAAGLVFRQGTPPDVIYLFKHVLVQDAAHGTLLREPRRALHARIAATLETQFTDIVERQPEVMARHCTEAGLIEKAAHLWGKAGQRSLNRSALIEAVEQLSRALAHIAALPSNVELRREQIGLQVALINPLMHVKGYAAPETKEAAEQARRLIEQAELNGEPPDEPLLLFSILYGFWVAHYVAFDGDVICDLAAQFLTLAEERQATLPLVTGHRLMGASYLHTGEIIKARTHLDKAMELYQPAEHRRGAHALRSGCPRGGAFLSVTRAVAAWLSGCGNPRRSSFRCRCARHRAGRYRHGGPGDHVIDPHPLWQLRAREGATRRSLCLGGREKRHVLEGRRHAAARLRVGAEWQSGRCRSDHRIRTPGMALDRSVVVDAGLSGALDRRLRRPRPFRRRMALLQ